MADPVDELAAFAATTAGAYGVLAGIASAATNAGDVAHLGRPAAVGAFVVGGLGAVVGVDPPARRRPTLVVHGVRRTSGIAVRAAVPGVLVVLAAPPSIVVVLLVRHVAQAGDLWALLDPGIGGGVALASAASSPSRRSSCGRPRRCSGPGFALGTEHLGRPDGVPARRRCRGSRCWRRCRRRGSSPAGSSCWASCRSLAGMRRGLAASTRARARTSGPRSALGAAAGAVAGFVLGVLVGAVGGRGRAGTHGRRRAHRADAAARGRARSWRWAAHSARRWPTIVEPVPPAPRTPARLVVLVSGSGTNLQALIDASTNPDYGVEIVAVGADRDGIEGLARAERHGIETFVLTTSPTTTTVPRGTSRSPRRSPRTTPDLVVLRGLHEAHRAGVPRPLRRPDAQHAPGPVAGVPRHARAARRARVRRQGHGCDAVRRRRRASTPGPIVAQVAVPVLDDDDESTLHERIKTSERAMLVEWVGTLARHDFHLDDRAVRLGGPHPERLHSDLAPSSAPSSRSTTRPASRTSPATCTPPASRSSRPARPPRRSRRPASP